MALATMGGGFMTNIGVTAALKATHAAIREPLARFRAQYGTPMGVSITLDNGVVGHFDLDGNFQLDSTPPDLLALAEYARARAEQTPPTPSNIAPFQPPPAIPPRSPHLPPPLSYGAHQPPPAAPAKIFGLPPLAVAAGAGLLIFLVARRF